MRKIVFASLALVIVAGAARSAEQNQPVAEVRYSVEQAGNVSLAVYEKESGRMLRTLLSAEPRTAGKYAEPWDGLDMNGNAVPPGTYEWKLLQTPGLKSEYLLTLGTSPTAAAWATWPGNHGGVTSVAVDDTGMYLSSSCSEVPPGVLKQSLDAGKRIWERGNYEAWQGGVSMAVSSAGLLQLQGNGKIQVIDPASGNRKATWDPTWKEETDKKDDKGNPVVVVHKPVDLAASGNLIVICYKDEGLVRWLNAKDGSTAGEAAVPEPVGVAAGFTDDAGRRIPTAFAASNDRILAIRTDTKAVADFATGLTEPYRLDADPNGEILVAERGASHQVKRFSKTGKLLNTYGKAGGRREQGSYDQPTSFYCVDDIASDHAGGFFILEPGVAPRRTTRFDANGKIISEWYGGQMFFQYACADPADPTLVWMDSQWGWIMQAKVDYKKRTSRIIATYRCDNMANGLISGTGNSGSKWQMIRKGKAAYLIRHGAPVVLRVDEKNHRLVPLAAASTNITHYWDHQPKFIKDLLQNDSRSKWRSYVWSDANGDAMPQPDEVVLSEWSAWWGGWSMNEDFGVVATDGAKVYAFDATSFTKAGAPLYADWGKPR